MSNEAKPPNAPYGSPERRAYWANYWNQWGGSNETHREVAGIITDLEDDIITQQNLIGKYQYYQSLGLSFAVQAIAATQANISAMRAAIAQKEIEFVKYLNP